ncbi:MAG: flagellar basal body P-ring formation chaperone FlgA [Alphaproteobacteria bacterium]
MAGRLMKASLAAALMTCAFAGAAWARPVELKAHIQCAGPAVTLGDVFMDAGEMSGRAVAPAPAPGARATFSARFLAAAAAAAGLEWSPPAGVDKITVIGAGGARVQSAAFTVAAPAIKRGDTVVMVYVAPGLQLTARGKALSDAAVGQTIRLTNLQSSKTVEAVVTGAGTVTVQNPQTF